ncbi:MAG: T9SS type A sorting domain-containing protein, partial [Ginsengibacter sp.]
RIIQFHGEGTQPGNYPGTEVMIDPADDSIVWNAANNYWEINFSVSGFSGFYLSSTTSVLPVRLISFKGLLNADKHVDLDWKVAEQQGIVSYEIEKSTTGNDFDKIGFVTANNQNSFTYHFADDRPFSGTVFYRLKIIEQDGGFNYSQIISVNYVASNAVKLYPIPAGSIIYLKLNDEKFIDSDAIILDISGKTVKRFTINSILQNIDISLLASGTYYLHLINGPAIKFQKL